MKLDTLRNPFFDSLEFKEKKIEYDWRQKRKDIAEMARLKAGITLHKNTKPNKRIKSKRKKRR